MSTEITEAMSNEFDALIGEFMDGPQDCNIGDLLIDCYNYLMRTNPIKGERFKVLCDISKAYEGGSN